MSSSTIIVNCLIIWRFVSRLILLYVTDRSGIFQDKAFTEAFPFTLRLRMLRNPDMALNGRFPTAVGDFKYEINR